MNEAEEQLLSKFIPLIRDHLNGRRKIPLVFVPTMDEKPAFTVIKIESEEFEFDGVDKGRLKKRFEKVAVKCAQQEDDVIKKFDMKTLFLLEDWQLTITGNKAKLNEKIAVLSTSLIVKVKS